MNIGNIAEKKHQGMSLKYKSNNYTKIYTIHIMGAALTLVSRIYEDNMYLMI